MDLNGERSGGKRLRTVFTEEQAYYYPLLSVSGTLPYRPIINSLIGEGAQRVGSAC